MTDSKNGSARMKAVVCSAYGAPQVLLLTKLNKPVPKNNEVLIRVHATTVTAGDSELRRFKMPALLWIPVRLYIGVWKPKQPVLGMEFSGEIESLGKDVQGFKKGDAVFAATGVSFGAYAEYKCHVSTYAMALKPNNLSYREAATVPIGGLNALHFIRRANIKRGQKVLIYAASGSIGTYAVQLASYYGAEVTAVCSEPTIELVRSLGATHVIDYKKEDFTKNGERYDVIFDTIGKSSFFKGRRSLNKNGIYLLGNTGLPEILMSLWTTLTSRKKVLFSPAGENTHDLIFLKELIEAGKLKPVIDKTYSLEDIQEAHAYVDKGFKTGNVVVRV